MVNWTLVFASFGAVVATFDAYWFLRLAYTRLITLFRQRMAITDVSYVHIINYVFTYLLPGGMGSDSMGAL